MKMLKNRLVQEAMQRIKASRGEGMAKGGLVEDDTDMFDDLNGDDEMRGMHASEETLAMNDTYPRFDNEESDEMGQDMQKGLDKPLNNETGDADQDEARRDIIRRRARKLVG